MSQEKFITTQVVFEGMEDVISNFSQIEKLISELQIEDGLKKYFTTVFNEFKDAIYAEENPESIAKLKDTASRLMSSVAQYAESKNVAEVRFSATVTAVAMKVIFKLSSKELQN